MMDLSNKKRLFIILIIFMALLIGTNAATYYLSAAQNGPVADADQHTIIRYEPRTVPSLPEAELIFEAMGSIRSSYFYPVETEVMVEGAVRGLIDNIGDPYVRFFDPEDLEEFEADTRGSYGGIGIQIVESNDYVVVFEVFPGSPAEQSGLNPGDRLVEADGNPLIGEGTARAVELLRGPPDTTVDILIQRPGADLPLELTVARQEIIVSTVSSEVLENGLGYIKINSFDSNTAREFTEQFRVIEQSGLSQGLILDLRNNPGGLVDQAVEIGKQLVPEGEIVRLVGRDEDVHSIYYSSAVKKPYPIIVLINEDSASAAELLAGALQDRRAALLVGKTTYGKASVQHLEYLSGGNAILITVAKYFTPSGHNIDNHGVVPDFEVEMPEVLRYYRYFHPGRLELGSYGVDVEMLQMMLEQVGYDLEISGYFDQKTEEAIMLFQGENGLHNSGEFDDRTWIELRDTLDLLSREQDQQLNQAIDFIKKPGLFTLIGGN